MGLPRRHTRTWLEWLGADDLGASVTDVDIQDHAVFDRLRDLPNLRMVSLFGHRITDASLKQLTGITGLQRAYLDDTLVTEKGVAELRNTLPGCKVGQLPRML